MEKIENCYDRAYETQQFLRSSKRVIALTDCKGNGTTLFLQNKLINKAYIFLTENKNGEIIMASAHKRIEDSKDDIDQFLNSCIKEIDQIKLLANFLYLDKINGTLFRNLTNDSLTIYQKKLQSLNSFDCFFDYYCNYYDFENHGHIYLIIDKANVLTEQFLRKIKKMFDKNYRVKLIFTFITPYIPIEFINLFNDIEIINFGKPIFENARIIFKNMNLDESCIDEKMYNSCANFEDFQKKYNEIQKLKFEKAPEPISLFFEMLKHFDCRINKYILNVFYEYITNTGCVNKQINFEEIYLELHDKMIISLSEGEESIKINLFSSKYDNTMIDFDSFIIFLLDKEDYHLLNYEALYFIFKLDSITPSSKFILEVFMRSTNIKHIKEILKLHNYFIKDTDTYLLVFAKLYNMKLFNYIPKINELKLDKFPYKILYQLIDEKKHKKTSDRVYIDCIKEYFSTNINFACLIEIMYFDYCINHKRNKLEKFFEKDNVYYYENYSKSKYYYILQNIVAYHFNDFNLALKVFDESINKCLDKSNENITYFLNNKFVYLLKEYLAKNEYANMTMLKEIYESIIANQSDEVLSRFISNNIGLYLSCSTKENRFSNTDLEYENTWDLFNAINSLVFNFQYNIKFEINDYLNLEKYVIRSNRIPTKVLYYYNLYVISKKYKIPFISKLRIYFAMLNDINYKNTDIYMKYRTAKKRKKDATLENLVKYGYISSRVFDINYLIDEIETFNK